LTSKVFRPLHPFGYGGVVENHKKPCFSTFLKLFTSTFTFTDYHQDMNCWGIILAHFSKKKFFLKVPRFREIGFWSLILEWITYTPNNVWSSSFAQKVLLLPRKSHTLLSPLPRFYRKKVFYERFSLIFKTSVCEFAQIMGFWDPENDILSSGSKYIGAAVLKQSLVYVSSLYVSFILLKFWLNRFLKVCEDENVISALNSKEIG